MECSPGVPEACREQEPDSDPAPSDFGRQPSSPDMLDDTCWMKARLLAVAAVASCGTLNIRLHSMTAVLV